MWVRDQTSGFRIGSVSELAKISSVLRFIILPCLAVSFEIQTQSFTAIFNGWRFEAWCLALSSSHKTIIL